MIAGLVMLLFRQQLSNRFAKQHASVRDKFSFLPGAGDPTWLRPLVPIVGLVWLLAGVVMLGLLLAG